MKKFLFLCISLISLVEISHAQDFKVGGVYYKILSDGVSVEVVNKKGISTSGQDSYKGSVIIPSTVVSKKKNYTVTGIGANAFYRCDKLTSITLPNTVTTIGERAFFSCEELASITLPNSLKTIKKDAFSFCNLTTITLPDALTTIGHCAFDYNKKLTSITIPRSATIIGGGAFARCSNLKEIINNSYNFIVEGGILYDRSKQTVISALKSIVRGSITLPSTVIAIGDYAFSDCNITSITFPNSVKTIGRNAFWSCDGLTSITLPNSITTIGNSAFAYCDNLKSVNVPSSVKNIDNSTFLNCKKLVSITIPYGTTYNTGYVSSSSYYPRAIKQTKAAADKAIAEEKAAAAAESRRLAAAAAQKEKDMREGKGSLSDFVKHYIEQDINKWQIKGEFETTAAWKERVNETTRKNKINALVKMYSNTYYDMVRKRKTTEFESQTMSLKTYDADNQSFLIQTTSGDILLPVPISTAQSFKTNWESVKKSAIPKFTPSEDDMVLSAITFTYAGKQYTYDSNTNVKYAITDIKYNFDPINIDGTSTVAKTSGIGGNANIERRNISVGASDVATNIPQTNIKNDNTFVLIIANENYTSEAQVNFAINDGQTFKMYCERTLGVPVRNIKIVENATVGSMSTNISWLQRVLKSYGGDANAIIYYSGHGVPNEAKGDAYLLPTDITGADYQYAYSLDKLYKEMGDTGAGSITYFIDACFSGAKRDGDMMVAARGVAIKAKSGVLSGNSVAFTASSGDETAFAYNEKGHGMFTYFLLKKLQESKGNVTYGELASYISTHVTRQSNIVNPKAQTPTVIPSPTLQSSWQQLKFVK